jgi:hypothetical protein
VVAVPPPSGTLITVPLQPHQKLFVQYTLVPSTAMAEVVLGERHLLRLVRAHVAYYNEDRPHMALDGEAPLTRLVEQSNAGRIIAFPRVGGLHRRYSRAA